MNILLDLDDVPRVGDLPDLRECRQREGLGAHWLVRTEAAGAKGARFAQLDDRAHARMQPLDLLARRPRSLGQHREDANHAGEQGHHHGGAHAMAEGVAQTSDHDAH